MVGIRGSSSPHVPFVHELQEFTLTHDRVAEVQAANSICCGR